MLQNCSILKIADVFFNEPTKTHYLMEISRKSKIAHTSVKNYLIELKKNKIINEEIEKRGERKFPGYKANLNEQTYKSYKCICNKEKILDSGLIEQMRDKIMPKSIILFGSFSRGEDIETSDIDLFIESKKQEINLDKFEKILKRKIQLHFNENFNNYPKELKNNIINGEILYGYLEVFK
ncbi:MAG: nucleotidyltransferase domain-containing protein [Candidatus Pacearchaeota archaeon]|jgi:predicted nucleotidyltransferase